MPRNERLAAATDLEPTLASALRSVPADTLDCLQSNLAVLTHWMLGASTELRLGDRPAFPDAEGSLQATVALRLQQARSRAGLALSTPRPVVNGAELVELVQSADSPVYVVSDAVDLPWLPYYRREQMPHSFLVCASPVQTQLFVLDAYHNETRWGAARPGAWRLALPRADELLASGTGLAVTLAAEVADAVELPACSRLAGVNRWAGRPHQMEQVVLDVWLVERNRRLHSAWLASQDADEAVAAWAPSLERWRTLAASSYIALRRAERAAGSSGAPYSSVNIDSLVVQVESALLADLAIVTAIPDSGTAAANEVNLEVEQAVRQSVCTVLGVDTAAVRSDVALRSLTGFDSFRLLEIIDRIEARIGRELPADAAASELSNIAGLVGLFRRGSVIAATPPFETTTPASAATVTAVPAPIRLRGPLHALLDWAAARQPTAVALRWDTEQLNYAELAALSRAAAATMLRAGVRAGDRVMIAAARPESVPELVWACSRIGAVFVVVNHELPAGVAAHILADAEPALVVADAGVVADAARARGLSVAAPAGFGVHGPLPEREPLPVDPASLVYTSGSTALPKAVVSTHEQMCFVIEAIQSRLGYRPDDIVHCVLPLSFDYGLYQLFLCAAAGAQLWLGGTQRTGPSLLRDLRRSGATVLPSVPPLSRTLARLAERGEPIDLRLISNTGAAMTPDLARRLRAALPGVQIQLMYGLTECKRAAVLDPDEDLVRPGSCGRALPETEIWAAAPNGVRLGPGEVGELVVRGPNVMAGYWRRPELTAAHFPRVDGLFPQLFTGDRGAVDGEGYVYLHGRDDDVYKERGTRTSTIEVESAASLVDGVRVAAVVPPGDGVESATLLVEFDEMDRRNGDEVLAELAQHLEASKLPSSCLTVPRVPVTANGKIDRARSAALGRSGAQG